MSMSMFSKWIISGVCFFQLALFGLSSCKEPKYTGPVHWRKLYEAIDEFAQKYCLSNHMKLINVGNFPDLEPRDNVLFGFWLRSFASIELQACRKNIIPLVEDFWKMLKQNSLAQQCFEDSS